MSNVTRVNQTIDPLPNGIAKVVAIYYLTLGAGDGEFCLELSALLSTNYEITAENSC
jgi:hypothetical protein